MTINEIIIVTTFGVCLACIFAGVWAIIMTRVLYVKKKKVYKQNSNDTIDILSRTVFCDNCHKGVAEEFNTICGCYCFIVEDRRHPTYKIFVIE